MATTYQALNANSTIYKALARKVLSITNSEDAQNKSRKSWCLALSMRLRAFRSVGTLCSRRSYNKQTTGRTSGRPTTLADDILLTHVTAGTADSEVRLPSFLFLKPSHITHDCRRKRSKNEAGHATIRTGFPQFRAPPVYSIDGCA